MTAAPRTVAQQAPAPLGLVEAAASWKRAPVPQGYLEMMAALRRFQDDLSSAVPTDELVAETARALDALAERFRRHAAPESRQLAGKLHEVAGNGQAMVPPIPLDHVDDTSLRGRVTLGRFYLGGNGAAHGGVVPLVFDDVLGRLANVAHEVPARTAYLNVNFRSITPIDTELRVEATVDRVEGRKRFVTGTLHHGDVLCADAEGLFVELRPGQP